MMVKRAAVTWMVFAWLTVIPGLVATPVVSGAAASPAAKQGTGSAAKKDAKDTASRRCPDLKADRIEFSLLSKTGQSKGRVRITGVIRNVGTKEYKSSPNQQQIMLYAGNTLVGTKAFQTLAVNQEEKIVYEREWDAAAPAQGEKPPAYRLTVLFDPDIAMDGNEDNDDCNSANNHISRSGADINSLFGE